jgi:transposase
MLIDKNISIHLSCQQFECNHFDISEDRSVLLFRSKQDSRDVICPFCGGRVHVYDSASTTLKDMPLWFGVPLNLEVEHHRYRCTCCNKSFSEELCMRCPGTRITNRAARWVQELLRWHLPISAVHGITGFHWDTIRRIHESEMQDALDLRRKELQDKDYRPQYLAIDEFAVHRGHSYATCVMDLVEGDILWVGRGRSKADFARFFEEFDLSNLSEVKAVAMDMNASYNILVEQHLPHAEIVYDRYHMQAQFGKDVLGVVRLQEARTHRQQSRELLEACRQEKSVQERRHLQAEAKRESHLYSTLKSSRWTLLTNGENLSPEKAESLNAILESHSDLALCYAMKEEMCNLFDLRNPDVARRRWTEWFEGAKASGIPALVKFAELKEKRLDGLVAHATHNISTGRLEGFNNKIKVAKRIGYGYRNEEYFFSLIRYMSIPAGKSQSPRKT